jgi:hypothetical protein
MRGSIVVVLSLLAVPAWGAEPVPLVSEAQVAELCKALQPTERQAFAGNVAARAQAKAAFEKEQEKVKHTHFLLELGWGNFTVSEWDEAEKLARLSTERPFRAFRGALTLFDAGRDEIELDALEGEAAALKEGLSKGTLTLALLFKPAEEEGAACVVSKAKTYAFSMDLLSVELREKGRTLARSVRDELQAMPSKQGKPTVEIRTAAGGECQDCAPELVEAVVKLSPDLVTCYAAALAKKPTLDGSLVLQVHSAKAGELAVATVIADSLDDASLLSCARLAVGKGKPSKAGKAQVLIEFGRR